MAINCYQMTNRELHTKAIRTKPEKQYDLVREMARRLNMEQEFCWNPNREMREHVISEFSHWKLNGAGDERR